MSAAWRYTPFLLLTLAAHLLLFSSRWSMELTPPRLELQEGRNAIALRLVPSRAAEAAPDFVQKASASEAFKPTVVDPPPALPDSHTVAVQPPIEPASKTPVPSSSSPPATPSAATPQQALPAELPVMDPSERARDAAPPAEAAVASLEPQGTVVEAHPISSRKPEYPPRSVLRGEQGRVVVHLDVNREGRATAVTLAESSGHYRLDRSVLRFVRKERFVPAMRGELPVASSQAFSFRFVLEEDQR